jgi:hypothetical protein
LKELTAVMLIGTSDLILPREYIPNIQSSLMYVLDKINPWQCRPTQNFAFLSDIDVLEYKNICQQKHEFGIHYIYKPNAIQWNLWNHYVICERYNTHQY